MNLTPAMNLVEYQTMATPQHWGPPIPPNPPPSSTFWTHFNVQQHLQDLHQTLSLATALEKELEVFMKVKEGKGFIGKRVDHDHDNNNDNNNDNDKDNDVVEGLNERLIIDEYRKVIEDNRIDLNAQEVILVEAVNGVMSKLRFLLEPFRVVVSDETPWEEKSAVVRLSDKVNKSKRNKLWRKRKRRRVADSLAKKGEEFERLDREADEWRAKEIAKDMAQQKVEKMKQIAKQKAKEERKKLEAELELALMVEKLQELRSIRIQKLKKQGHFFPEEDDKFLERVRVAVEEEERQAKAAADTDAAKEAIAAAEESRKVTQGTKSYIKDESSKENDGTSQQQGTQDGSRLESTSEESGKLCSGKQSYGAYDYVANLPPEFYHYYHGSNTDMGTLIEVRRTWDAYLRPGGSRIPGHWVQPPPPADEVWASYLVQHN